jgi:hypothetical protein
VVRMRRKPVQSWGELQNDTLERGKASNAMQHKVDGRR